MLKHTRGESVPKHKRLLAAVCVALPVISSSSAYASDNSKKQPTSGWLVVDNEAIRQSFSPRTLRAFFGEQAENIDFAKLQEESEIGRRQFDLYVDGRFVIRQNVELFRKGDGKIGIRIPAMVLLIQDLKFSDLPGLHGKMPLDMIEDIDELIPGASVSFDALKARADVSIPRAWFASFAQLTGFVPAPRWTYGIPALVMNYQANAEYQRYEGESYKHGYLNLDGRFNFNEWRLFGSGNFSVDENENDSNTDFDRGNIYLTRVFGSNRTRIKAGEIHTQSFYQDSVPMLGVELYDDESMLSSAERGYVPVITGIAQTSARVTVRQFGRIVFERNVQPGPFSFVDLPGLTSGTDLEVTIREENGTERTFTVPYMETPLQLRAGRVHFNVSAGRWHENGFSSIEEKPFVFSGGIGYGLPYDLSVFGGTQISENYWNATAGIASNLGLPGAVSLQFDRSQYSLRHDDDENDGLRMRMQWMKRFTSIGSYVSASWRHYLSGRYLSLSESLSRRKKGWDDWQYVNLDGDLKDEASLSFTQTVGNLGNWHLSGTYYRFQSDRERSNLSTSFTTNWKGVSISVSLQHARSTYAGNGRERETICFANLSIPLSLFFGYNATAQYVTMGMQRDDDGEYRSNVGVSGVFGEKRLWSYALSTSHGDGSQTFNGSISREGGFGRATLSGSYDEDSSRLALFGEGSLIGTSYGLFPAKRVSGASAIIEVPDAPEAVPEQYSVATRTDDSIFITDLNNYQSNDITIDPNSVPANVMMPIYMKRLVPADDAVLAVKYETMKGWQFVPELSTPDGAKLPFGARVRIIAHGLLSGMDTVLNERSRAYFAAAPITGVVEAVWLEKNVRHACFAPYSLKKETEANPKIRLIRKSLVCRKVPSKTSESTVE